MWKLIIALFLCNILLLQADDVSGVPVELASRLPIITSPKIAMVLWGNHHIPQVTGPGMVNYYKQYLKSNAYTWIIPQYDTKGKKVKGKFRSTNQILKPGSFKGRYHLTNVPQNEIIPIQNFGITLNSSINSGLLPYPSAIVVGGRKFVNTLYVIHLSKGTGFIVKNRFLSCRDFCGYHLFFTFTDLQGNTLSVPYAVLPDHSSAACLRGCGTSGNPFLNLQSDASHEILEAATDPWIVVFANTSVQENQLADACEGVDEAFTGTDGKTYVATRAYDGVLGHCIGTTSSSFTIAFPFTTVNPFDKGTAQNYQITTTAYNTASPDTISFSVDPGLPQTGLPAGWGASFSPNPVVAGNPVTLTITSAGGASPPNFPIITIVGVGTGTNARIKLELPVSNLLNGYFASDLSSWTITGLANWDSPGVAQIGTFGTQSTLSQTFVINANFLFFSTSILCCTPPPAGGTCFTSNTTHSTGNLQWKLRTPTHLFQFTRTCAQQNLTGSKFVVHHQFDLSQHVGQTAHLSIISNSLPSIATVAFVYQMQNSNTKTI